MIELQYIHHKDRIAYFDILPCPMMEISRLVIH